MPIEESFAVIAGLPKGKSLEYYLSRICGMPLGESAEHYAHVMATQGSGDQGGGATGDAVAADVADGKTFSNAVATGLTGTSTKNATVPNDAPIQPPQAFVDAFYSYSSAANLPGFLAFPNKGITGVNTGTGANSFRRLMHSIWNQNSNTCPIDLSGNAMDQQSVDSVIASAVANINMGDSQPIDLSGGTNAAPTLPVFVIDFNNLSVNGTPQTYGLAGVFGAALIEYDTSTTLASGTTISWTGDASTFFIGISDSPTKQQIIDKLVSLGGGKITDIGGLKIRVSPTDYNLLPLDFSGMTGSSLTQGSNDIGTLRANGWTVTTN